MSAIIHRQISANLQKMRPGQRCYVSDTVLRQVECIPGYSPEDTLLEGIAGSGYEFGYMACGDKPGIAFYRLQAPLNDGRRSYVSPDRRHHYTKGVDGLWEPRNKTNNPG